MSAREDMLACQCRNDAGYPKMASSTLNAAPGAAVHSRVDQSVNKSLPWFAVAVIMAAIALGLELRSDALLDAKVDKAKAEMRSEFAQELADAKAESRLAGTDAAIAKNSVQKLEARFNADRRQ